MDTTIIDKDNLQYFESLLLPQTKERFAAGKPVFALGAVDDGMACGALTGGPVGESFFIDSLFVSASCRGRGAGTALLNELIRIASQQERLQELRCSFTMACEDHVLLPPFLSGHGFHFEDIPNAVVAIPLGALAELAFYKNTQSACRVYTLEETSESMIRALDKRLALNVGPILDQPLDQAALDRACSTVTIKSSAIDACLLIENKGEKLLSLAYADAGSTIGSGSVFSSMLITTYHLGAEKYPPETQVLIQPVTELSQALVNRLAPNARKLSYSAVRPLR